MQRLLDELTQRVDVILAHGQRTDVLALLALLAGQYVLAKERARELRQRAGPARSLTVAQACAAYPISRSWLYERGEELRVAHRVDGSRRLIIDEAALLVLLHGRRRG